MVLVIFLALSGPVLALALSLALSGRVGSLVLALSLALSGLVLYLQLSLGRCLFILTRTSLVKLCSAVLEDKIPEKKIPKHKRTASLL